ncbi:MAG: DHH family phosphoesterase, partial [Atopobium minutum]|nr:DHH family phosphoesterase [Atopobium minutum]
MTRLDGSKRWEVLTPHADAEQRLQSQLHVSPLVARIMAARGFDANTEAQHFLQPDLDRDWLDPYIIPNMEQGASQIAEAITADKTISVFGDFDVDGITSTCLLTLALRRMGANHVRAYIPHRFDEGYGLSAAALDRVMADGKPDLIITVDNGISAAHEVAWLLEQGIDVVVTDHHEP